VPENLPPRSPLAILYKTPEQALSSLRLPTDCNIIFAGKLNVVPGGREVKGWQPSGAADRINGSVPTGCAVMGCF
jgi:hypothetical protein